jgi:hypothetical protein
MATRLEVYNTALLLCGERSLSSLSEDREPRRNLDQAWNGGGVNKCLEEGQWRFAMRTVQIDYDPSIEPDFGYRRVFNKPDDWICTSAVCSDEYFSAPLTAYTDEGDQWYADIDTIYLKYISSDEDWGMNMGKWPQSFSDFVSAHLASRVIMKMADSEEKLKLILQTRERFKRDAKNAAAMAEPTKFPARGTWSRARTYGSSRRDGGNNNGNLTG